MVRIRDLSSLWVTSLTNMNFIFYYRRGILQPPEPRIIELNAQAIPSTEAEKPMRVRWKAKGALKTSLYQNNIVIPQEFRPSDEYETTITNTKVFNITRVDPLLPIACNSAFCNSAFQNHFMFN